jgi:DNA-binding winged helix-turn-helix (wHTH) protein/TolB-like protein
MAHNDTMQRYSFDSFEFDAADGRLSRTDSAAVDRLRPAAAIALLTLVRAAGDVVDREQMRAAIWGPDRVVDFEAGLAALIRDLRKSIEGLGGDAAVIETIPKRGYRLRAAVRRHPERSGAEVSDADLHGERNAAVTGPVQASPWSTTLKYGLPGAVAMVVILVIAAVLVRPESAPVGDAAVSPVAGPAQSMPSLAILPIRVYGESALLPEHVDLLLADTLLAELWRAGPDDLTLLGRIAIEPYLDRDDLIAAVAEDLGLSLLLQGSLRASPSGWWLDLQLLQIPPGRMLWSHRVGSEAGPLQVAELAAALAAEIKLHWPEIRSALQNE